MLQILTELKTLYNFIPKTFEDKVKALFLGTI